MIFKPNSKQIEDLTVFLKSMKVSRFKGLGIEVEFHPDYSEMVPEKQESQANITEEQLKFFSAEPDVLVRT
jgi:hypothetical protein